MNPALLGIMKNLRNLLFILIGNTIYALAVVAFLLPSGIITGGATGLGLFVHHAFGLPVSGFIFCFNVVMFGLGAALLGKKFALTTLASTFFYPLALAFWQHFDGLSHITQDPMLCMIFGGLMIGAGIGIVIRAGASTGGMDIPPLLLHKKWGLPVSVTLYVFDILILIFQMFFSDIEQILYGFLLVLLYTFVLDKTLVIGLRQAKVEIISAQYTQIREEIFSRLDRGCTLLHARTGYMQIEQPVLMTVVSRRELTSLNRLVSEIDPKAFLIITDAHEVRGQGFTLQKVYQTAPGPKR